MSTIGCSFRDPSGQVFESRGVLYRGISSSYQSLWQYLNDSGLYANLQTSSLLIPYETTTLNQGNWSTVIKPAVIPFISYPYEWCFSQLQDAALATLRIQKTALHFNMTLKDASTYNIQFYKGKPILIDSLSFAAYRDGQPWVAYRQFCMHFLAPLLLMKYKSLDVNRIMQTYLDGIPIPLASKLLPVGTWLNPSIFMHIHLHAKFQMSASLENQNQQTKPLTKQNLEALIENLIAFIRGLSINIEHSHNWVDYYDHTNYHHNSLEAKKKIVLTMTRQTRPETVWDMGANTGDISHAIASLKGLRCIVAFDMDPLVTEINYRYVKHNRISNYLPLTMDLTNPSASVGWNNQERMSLSDRGPADTVLALALMHHLVIGNNVPTDTLMEYFGSIAKHLIIEFIPKEDTMVQKLLSRREGIYHSYTQESFEKSFLKRFKIIKRTIIPNSKRILYLMAHR